MKDIVYVVETVTPEQAEEWLKNQVANRPLRESRVFRYARDMDEGKWLLSGQPIKFNTNKQLIDGQHRLQAVTLAKKPVKMEIAWNVPDKVIPILDEGASRSFQDVLHFRNQREYYVDVAVAENLIWRACTGNLYKGGRWTGSRQELLQLDSDVGSEVAEICAEVRTQGGIGMPHQARMNWLGAGMTAGLALLFRRVDPKMADEFIYAMSHWPQLGSDHPVAVLQSRLIASAGGQRIKRLNQTEKVALAVRAWNAMLAGEKKLKLQISKKQAGSPKAAWPQIIGFDPKVMGPQISEVFERYLTTKPAKIAAALATAKINERKKRGAWNDDRKSKAVAKAKLKPRPRAKAS